MPNRLPAIVPEKGWPQYHRTPYSPEVALEVCDIIAEGGTAVAISRMGGHYPSRSTLREWLVDQPDFRAAYAAAREASAYTLEEEAIEAVRALREEPTQVGVRAAEVLANQLRWSAARRNMAAFSDRSTASLIVPIQINTTLDLGQGGVQAAQDPSAIYRVEAHIPGTGEGEKSPKEVMLEPSNVLSTSTPVVKEKRKAGRPPGHKMSDEQKRVMAEGRKRYHEALRAKKAE